MWRHCACCPVCERTFFASVGCRLSDHAFTTVPFVPAHLTTVNEIFKNTPARRSSYRRGGRRFQDVCWSCACAKNHYDLNGRCRFHIGAMRNNNTAMFEPTRTGHGLRLGLCVQLCTRSSPACSTVSQRKNKPPQNQSSTTSIQRQLWPRCSAQCSGRPPTARQDPVRIGVVVPRSEGRHGRAR